MAKSELGTKRLCPNCGAKYYDLFRDPIICPRCGASFTTGLVATRTEAAAPAPAAEEDEEVESDVEFVPLEEAEESGGDDDVEVESGVLEGVGEDIEGDEPFIADEEDEDVGDVVRGDVADGEDEDR